MHGKVKVNWNVAANTHNKKMGICIVIRDNKGEVFVGVSLPNLWFPSVVLFGEL